MAWKPTVIVTGCTRGLGAIFSQELLLRGFRVILTGRGENAFERMQEVADDAERELAYRLQTLKDRTGHDPEMLRTPDRLHYNMRYLDLDDRDSIKDLCHFAAADVPDRRIVLVNNAASLYTGWSPEAMQRSVQTNVFGTMTLTESLLPIMGKGSSIVHVLCANCRPRIGGHLSRDIAQKLHLLSRQNPEIFMKKVRQFDSMFQEDAFMQDPVRVEKASLVYSKSLQYIYAMQNARAVERSSDITVNGVCPGALGTRLSVFPNNRNPFEATGQMLLVSLFNPTYSARARVSLAAGDSNRPHGKFFEGEKMTPFDIAIDPRRADTTNVSYGRSTFQEVQDWRVKFIRKRQDTTLMGKFKSMMGM